MQETTSISQGTVAMIAGVIIIALAAYAYFIKRTARRRFAIMQAIVDSYGEPLLFYDHQGHLIFMNSDAVSAFSDIREQIKDINYIRENSKPEGPGYYFSDMHGNGYRLEIMKKKYDSEQGDVVRVKGYARAKPLR